ncbi:MAG TPA: hypothetical protein ENK23_04645, partial [Sorangium sp.]|nr:hypothetical protein [Sorangium sp.]
MTAATTARTRESTSDRARRWRIAVLLYLALTAAYASMLPTERWRTHTPYNHYALQAEAWLDGHLALAAPPPAYAGNNDFARYRGRHFISFPPVPAALILPAVAMTGSAAALADGRYFLWFSALAPMWLFLTLEALRRDGRVSFDQRTTLLLAATFGLGTVYWFSAVQGTVWFVGHVVGAAALCGYLWASVGARFPALAGLMLALAVGTRPSLSLALPFFVHELWRSNNPQPHGSNKTRWLRKAWSFALVLGAMAVVLMVHNWLRFADPCEFGHRYLTVVWRGRIDRWGLFSPHYLGRNLAVMLTGLPFVTDRGVQINGHGLALWLT